MKGWAGIPIQEVVDSFQLLHSALIHIFIYQALPDRSTVCLSVLSVCACISVCQPRVWRKVVSHMRASVFLFCLWSFYLPLYSELSMGGRTSLTVRTYVFLSNRCLSACLSEITRPHFPSGKVWFRIILDVCLFDRSISLSIPSVCLYVFLSVCPSYLSLSVSVSRRKVQVGRISLSTGTSTVHVHSVHQPASPVCLSVCPSYLSLYLSLDGKYRLGGYPCLQARLHVHPVCLSVCLSVSSTSLSQAEFPVLQNTNYSNFLLPVNPPPSPPTPASCCLLGIAGGGGGAGREKGGRAG